MVGLASRGEPGGIGCGGGGWEIEAGSDRSWRLSFLQSPPMDERSAGSAAQCGGGVADVVTGRGGDNTAPLTSRSCETNCIRRTVALGPPRRRDQFRKAGRSCADGRAPASRIELWLINRT